MPCKRYWDSLKKGDTIDGYCPLLKGQSLWKSHQKNMLKDKIDTTEFMIEYFEGVE